MKTTIRNPHKYGWLPDLPDARDKAFRYVVPPEPIALPSVVSLHNLVQTVFDQGQTGSCTSNAICQRMQCGMAYEALQPVILSRMFLYYNERKIEGTTQWDAGAFLRDGMKSAATTGVCLESAWPYSENLATEPTPAAYAAAGTKVWKYHSIDQKIAHLKHCLASGHAFVYGFTVYDSFESEAVAFTGNVPMPNVGSEVMLGGHAVCCIGYNDGPEQTFADGKKWPQGTFLVQNSWGPGWGLTTMAGCFTVPYGYCTDSDLSADFWTLLTVG